MKKIIPTPFKSSTLIASAIGTAISAQASTDYGPAIWRPTCEANWYSTGYGHKFHVIHDMEGYYASVISWFTSCGMTSASVHFAVNGLKDASSDYAAGEITQMISEAYYAWHACCWNQHSTGTEHEGFASNPAWYTTQQYQASAGISAHVASKFGYAKDRNHIVGHNEKSNAAWVTYANANLGISATCNTHSDPGPYWDWNYYMALVNPVPPPSWDVKTGQRMKGDFNGDGKEDVVIAYNYSSTHLGLWVFNSTGSAFTPALWRDSVSDGWDDNQAKWVAGDFNGDGKSDVAALYNYGGNTCRLFVFLSNGSSFGAGNGWWFSGTGNFDWNKSRLVAGDFNADGKSDIGIAYNQGGNHLNLWTFTSTGAAFTPALWYDNNGGWDDTLAKWVSGDFNGDGKSDVAALYNYGNSTCRLIVFPSSGTSFSTSATWWYSGVGNYDWNRASKLMAGDFDGNGKKDVAISYNTGNGYLDLWVFKSTGTAFTPQLWRDTNSGWDENQVKWVSGDFNGDGKTDVSAFYNYGNKTSKLWVFPSSGTGFPSNAVWWDSGVGNYDWSLSAPF